MVHDKFLQGISILAIIVYASRLLLALVHSRQVGHKHFQCYATVCHCRNPRPFEV